MAAANPRHALTAAADGATAGPRSLAERLRLSWLGLVGFGLMAALLAAALVQIHSFWLLRQTVQSGDDAAVVTILQAETDYLRLREHWREAALGPSPTDTARLRLHYAQWVRRVGLVQADEFTSALGSDKAHRRTLAEVDTFIVAAERVLGRHPAEPQIAAVRALLPALESLEPALHALSMSAAQRAAVQVEQRANAMRGQSQLGLTLTVFLSLLTMAFALVALRQVKQLRDRRSALERLAASLTAARHQAESASEAKSSFLANLSHEIRTPFHGLMGMLSLLRETGLTPRQIDYLRTACDSADQLLALLNDILDMSQLESRRLTLAPVAAEPRALLRDVEALMRPQADAKRLALHVDADPAVPERVLLDPTRVKQILLHLLSNAIKFSERGAVVLDVRSHPPQGDASARAGLEFMVTDSGRGIDPAALAQLFSRFGQGDGKRSWRDGSSGLGLELSRSLARLMGGDITVRSRPGHGSTFKLSLPLQVPDIQPAGTDCSPGFAGLSAPRPLQVLVAEDHPVNRQYLAALLENMGHVAHFSSNGREAVLALQEPRAERFDVVLMDLHMPVLDGVDATRAIRALADPSLSTVPIVALTADAYEEARDRCLVAGMNDFLTKPVSPDKLATSLRRLFGNTVADARKGNVTAVLTGVEPASRRAAPVRFDPAQPLLDEATIAVSLQAMPAPRLTALIDAFLDQGPDTVRRLRAAVKDAQPLYLRANAHAAKGAALNLGLTGLAATAAALQDGATHLPAHEIARLVQRYEDQLPATREAVRGLNLTAPVA